MQFHFPRLAGSICRHELLNFLHDGSPYRIWECPRTHSVYGRQDDHILCCDIAGRSGEFGWHKHDC
jgi:hypothetical protein